MSPLELRNPGELTLFSPPLSLLLAAKPKGKKNQKVTKKFVIDATQPASDKIFDVAAFVSAEREEKMGGRGALRGRTKGALMMKLSPQSEHTHVDCTIIVSLSSQRGMRRGCVGGILRFDPNLFVFFSRSHTSFLRARPTNNRSSSSTSASRSTARPATSRVLSPLPAMATSSPSPLTAPSPSATSST